MGLKDLVVVATSDAVLVADKNRSEEVKKLVDKMKNEDIIKLKFFQKITALGDGLSHWLFRSFQVKRLLVN